MHGFAIRLLIVASLQSLTGSLSALEAGDLDGQWCSRDGRTISVSGTEIITPRGYRSTGVYGGNALSFSEFHRYNQPGPMIWMEPAGKDSARVSIVSKQQKEPPPHDLWSRCRVTSSAPIAGRRAAT